MSLEFAPGTTFAGYRMEAIVGRGGMGIVYRATELSLQRTVALKLIAPELTEDESFRRRFLRESRLAASLEHPNVVPIYDAGEHDGQLYLAMRYVEGSDLRTLLKSEGAFAPERSLALLGQVADALDAAHRGGLVHRDVKPANLLIDSSGHVYLTDFGVTKQLGGESTESGQLVGTLDYIAPEQIRGDPIDARADVYALACVLYQCLSGTAPFHRGTEAETLWAHMQEDPVPLAEHPTLTPVLKKGLAKQRDDRYASCAELLESARSALALGRVARGLLRRRHWIVVAGLLVVASTIGATLVALDGGGGPRSLPVDSGVAAIDANAGRFGALVAAAPGPSNVAVGAGGVWVLSTENQVISRIDPKSKRVVRTIRTSGHPVDLAAGAGALWVGYADAGTGDAQARVARLDPVTSKVTATAHLPHTPDRGGWAMNGHPGLAIGAGGAWAANREGTISRLDPGTGKLVATIDTIARRVAAGPEGVWVVGEINTITEIDPRTNKAGQTIEVGSNYLTGIAVGAGSVWAMSEEGRLWRIEPGNRPILQTIDVGPGSEYVAFGDGFVWTANMVDGTISRVDPRTNAAKPKVRVGAVQALAAGEGSAWVGVAEGARAGVLPASTCGDVSSGGARPDVLIASDLPLQGPAGADPRDMADAIRLVLADHGFRAGRFAVGYRSCDDSTAQTGAFEPRRCAANGNAYAHADRRLVAVIGPFNSGCAQVEIPLLNRAAGGPLAIVSPSNTFPGLTRGGRLALPAPVGRRGEPQIYYPTGKRNYMRVVARDDRQGTAHAMLARQLGLKQVYLLYSGTEAGNVSWTGPFRRAAARLGVGVAGVTRYDGTAAKRFRTLAGRIARTGADGVLIGGSIYVGGGSLLKALRARLGPRVAIMAGDQFEDIPTVLALGGDAARGLYVATSQLPPGALHPTAAAQRFISEFGSAADASYALHAAQAAEVVLQAIARSDGTRASVLRELWATDVKDGVLGDVRFDGQGDVAPARITILRVTGTAPPHGRLPSVFKGAVIDRVETIPASLDG